MNKILLRILFIIALIIAIALIALVVIRYTPPVVSYVSSASASLFNVFKKESLEVSAEPQTVISGNRTSITWSTENQESVSLSYECNNDYQVAYVGGNNTRIPIDCGENFELGGGTNAAMIIPTLAESETFADIEVIVNQERADNKKASGVAIITVTSGTNINTKNNSNNTSTKPTLTATTTALTTTTKQTPTTKPSTGGQNIVTYPTVTGPANLTISQPQIISTIIPTIQFNVTNNGGRDTGIWELRATLPNGDIFNSGLLTGIPAGGSTLFTLNVGSLVRGSSTIRVTVDANDAIVESNENDNTSSVTFNNSSSGNTGNGTRADLTVRVLSIGYVGNSDDIGIQFEIRNNGGTTAKDWYFEAELPTDNNEDFESKRQPDLKPGEAIEYTLRFDNAKSNGYATIKIDSKDDVRESDEDNNRIRFRITN